MLSSTPDNSSAISPTALLADSIIEEGVLVHEVQTEGKLDILYHPFCVEEQLELASLPVCVQKLF